MFSNKSKALILCLCTSLLLLGSVDVFAKSGSSGGGGRSGGGFSSTRPTSYSAKSAGATQSKQTYVSTTAGASSTFFNSPKPVSTTTKSGFASTTTVLDTKKGFAGTSVFDAKQSQVIKADKAIKAKSIFVADSDKFKNYKPQVYTSKADLPKNVQSNPLFSSTRVKSTSNYTTFSNNKSNYYNSHGWTPRPYMYTHSSYGGYDGLMFWMMLDNMSDMAMMATMYNHSGQAGFNDWKAEVEKQAKTDEKVAKQLEEMNAKLATMTGEKDPTKLPADMPVDVALASDALVVADKDNVSFKLATGVHNGIYCKGGNILKEESKTIDVLNVNTAGTMENLQLFEQGKIDGFIGQKDGIDSYAIAHPRLIDAVKKHWVPLYKEPVQLIANRKGDIKCISDLTDKHTIYVGKVNSGTENTWTRFTIANSDLRKVKIKNADPADALKEVIKDPNVVMLNVSGLNSDFLKAVDLIAATEKLRFVKITDDAIFDIKDVSGEVLYSYAKIPSGKFPNLQKGWFFSSATKTVTAESVLVISDAWIEKNGQEALMDLTAAITAMQPKLYEAANGEL